MRLALAALVLTVPAAAPAATPAPPGARQSAALTPLCRQDPRLRPVGGRQEPRAKRLGELPPADLTLTVVNRVGDCVEPVTVRQGYGALGSRR